jgi:Ni,Fe-hydrogenase III large subunit/NADH:ubiquinone oxidoreductase subunit C
MQNQSLDITRIMNGESIGLKQVSYVSYSNLQMEIRKLLTNRDNHCVNYYAYNEDGLLKFVMCIARDKEHDILILTHEIQKKDKNELLALSKEFNQLYVFEREIHENFGVNYIWHPWLKPVRFPHDSPLKLATKDYPFYRIDSEELHEVGVGPIHAGVIEPGHFRFSCNGETVLHLEIQLGWQHRGIEHLMVKKPQMLQKNLLAESITGDTTIGHTLAFVQLIESLSDIQVKTSLELERSIALELERIAIHTGDLSALCTDVAYQLGSSVFGALRTPIINFMQRWCGNRFGKGLLRVGGSHFPFNASLEEKLLSILDDFETRFERISEHTFNLDSVIQRFDDIGTLTDSQVYEIGGVGMVARMAGINKDVRSSHPFAGYKHKKYNPVTILSGDVMARAMLRRDEVRKSIRYIRDLLVMWSKLGEEVLKPMAEKDIQLKPSTFAITLTEGWRGEICHSAITDEHGVIKHYKVKDPSLHNWKALELALRNLEISDFPINNKSFDLSYCGHDL